MASSSSRGRYATFCFGVVTAAPGSIRLGLPSGIFVRAIDMARCFAEEPGLFGFRVACGDPLEARKDRVERSAQAVDREVAGEHRAIRAEHGDNLLDDPAIVADAPWTVAQANAGNLDTDVRLFGKTR